MHPSCLCLPGACVPQAAGLLGTPWAPGPAAPRARGPASETFTLRAVTPGLPRPARAPSRPDSPRFLSTVARGRQDLSLHLTRTELGSTEISLSSRTAVHQGRLHKRPPSGQSLSVVSAALSPRWPPLPPSGWVGASAFVLPSTLCSADLPPLVLSQLPLLLKSVLNFPVDRMLGEVT